MFLLALTYAYFQFNHFQPLQILEGLIWFPLLGALYSLNDLTDLKFDKEDPENRTVLLSKTALKEMILTFIIVLISIIFIGSTLP